MGPGRKTPFSGKAKKEQLKAKKQRKAGFDGRGNVKVLLKRNQSSDDEDEAEETTSGLSKTVKLGQARAAKSQNPREVSRYALQFYKETKQELIARKEQARLPLNPVTDVEKEIDCAKYFPKDMDIPKRPPWNFEMGRQELENREQRYFTKYISDLENKFGANNLSYFEMNLETWRQLWRVLEISDLVLIITDVRFPGLMFPPSVYEFVTEELKKDMLLVLNKIDLVPAHVVLAWKEYFKEKFPKLQIIMFTSFPSYNLRGNQTETKSGLQVKRRRGRQRMAAEGALKLYEACNEIVKGQADLSSWHQKILEEMETDDKDEEEIVEKVIETVAPDTSYEEHVRFRDGIFTIGCIGQPNVGKSSLMNAIMGRKVVSVSRTPGHTKHFQTIFLTKNVRLCDCPGLVFPSTTPRSLQILTGSYPIAQVREPFTPVRYLAERLDLVKLLSIQHPDGDDTWSAMDICDGWAKKKGFFTAKAARPDSNRAANFILRMALDGKLCLSLKPPGFYSKENEWIKHPDLIEITWIQAKKGAEVSTETERISDISEEDTTEESDGTGSDADSDQDSEHCPSTVANKFALLDDQDE